jgi:UDP-N-acetyl-D-galactosamine dehydrogenase
VALAKHFPTIGVDIDVRRIAELKSGHDRTGEIPGEVLATSSLQFTDVPAEAQQADFYIITVPTPLEAENRPDLSLVEAASRTVGEMLRSRVASGQAPIVVYESTVYPGVTEDLCGPVLERVSGLVCGRDFFLGYSPERINPGDREHTVDKIMKVVAGQTPEVALRLEDLYGAVTSGGVFRAASIKTAEAAKVIENAQRDINIAFMNEIAQIFRSMDISVWDVLSASRTKWNFLPFMPGLVGGHCIGVDPYYLAHRAKELGHDPRVILAGRGVNDGMADWMAQALDRAVQGRPQEVLVLGLTFKENVPDLRNSKVADLVAALAAKGHTVTVHDPRADPAEAEREYGLKIDTAALSRTYGLVVLAVPHCEYLELGGEQLRSLVAEHGLLADLKGALHGAADWTL